MNDVADITRDKQQHKALLLDVKQRPVREATELLADKPAPLIADVLMELNPGTAQDLLLALPQETVIAIMAATPSHISHQWLRNQTYPEGSIGRLMDPPIAVFRPEMTVDETIERLRDLIKAAFITYGYVIDETGKMAGVITMRDLLFNDKSRRLEDIMLRDVFSLNPEMPLSEAMKLVLNRHYPVYPVCDSSGHLVGLVRGQVMFEERTFEISAQPGSMVGVEKEERLATPLLRSLKFRHPWLQFNLLTVFLAAAVVGALQETIERLVILALFIPVLTGQSSKTGSQALAITVRGLTLGELKPGAAGSLIFKEATLGIYNGALVGVTAGLGMYAAATLQGSPSAVILGFVVFLALIGGCMVSGIFGVLVPLTLQRLGAGPDTASGIFHTAASDVASVALLLGLATILI